MRLISQDGTRDLPYESFVVELDVHSPTITAYTVACVDQHSLTDYVILAEYSTRGKARKVLQDMRENYRHIKEYENGLEHVVPNYYYEFPKE